MQLGAIFDLDGTLVDVKSIRYLVEGKDKNFDKFHNESINCQPFQNVAQLANNLFQIGIEIHILSGRTSNFQELSESWLQKNNVGFTSVTLRDKNDYRTDVIVKREMFHKIANKNIKLAIDDKLSLRNLWKELKVEIVLDPAEINISTAERILQTFNTKSQETKPTWP